MPTFAPLVLPPLAIPPPPGGGRHFDISSGNGWLYCALLSFLCKCPLSELISVIQTQMYATGTHVWYHSRSKGGLLLATYIGPSPSGPEFLHI